MPGTLHITNGDSVELREPGLGGEVLTWRDALHEGPVPAGLTLAELRVVRARFLGQMGGASEAEVLADLTRRDEKLAGLAGFDEVVLWFEQDLYDQLQLIQILDWLSRRERGSTAVSLISTDKYLGRMRPSELLALYPARQAVAAEQSALAVRAWSAFTSRNPRALEQLVHEDTSVLPYLHGALLRHLEQFPSARSGLSRTERQILEIAHDGVSLVAKIFQADQAREERIFMGDLAFYQHVRRLTEGRQPLLEVAQEQPPFGASTVAVTPDGAAVLKGALDAVRLNGIDRWLGGVHLCDGQLWRWNGTTQALEGAV
jgi:hypothetical protein